MVDTMANPTTYIEIGLRAKEYYQESDSIPVMARGMSDAIEYACKSKD